MYGIYYNRTTPFLAFLEGMVRVFDWGMVLELRKRWSKKDSESEAESRRDEEWSERIIDWYIRDSIATFEAEESENLPEDPLLPRRSCVAANILLGAFPVEDVLMQYEVAVSGAGKRIMEKASEKLKQDGRAEIELLKQRIRQGCIGMIVGCILATSLTGSGLLLVYTGHDAAGYSLFGLNMALVVSASVYISKAQVRRKYYTRDFFFFRKKRKI